MVPTNTFGAPAYEYSTLTTLILAVKPLQVDRAEVQPLTNDIVEGGDSGGDGGDVGLLVEGQRSVVHDGLVVVRCVQVCDLVILVPVEIVLHSCGQIFVCMLALSHIEFSTTQQHIVNN